MILIGESIHIISNRVNEAIDIRNASYVQQLAIEQTKAGADYIDVNLGPAKKEPESIAGWLVTVIQEVSDLLLAVLEFLLVVVDHVHLVDRDYNLSHAQGF